MPTDVVTPKIANKNAFLFVIVTVMIDMLSFGLIAPVMPALLSELSNLPPGQAVSYGGALSGVYALLNFAFSPTLGSLSDRFGRRPVLLFSLAMLGIDFCIMGFAGSLTMLFVGRALSGISGATIATANAYIADVTEPQQRGRAFGLVGAAFGIGFVLGPVVGGLLGTLSPRAPFFAAAGLSAVNTLYGFFVLPESLAKHNRRKFEWRRANPFGALRHFSKVPKVGWFIAAIGLHNLAHMVFPSTWGFHGEIRYGWTSREIGWSLGLVGATSAVVQALLIGRILNRLGPSRTALLGMVTGALALFGFAMAGAGWVPFVIIPLSALAGVTSPAINAIVTSQTSRDAQGELQGAISSVQSLGNIVSPIVMTQTLRAFSQPDAFVHFIGAPFLLASAVTVTALVPLLIGIKATSPVR